MKQRKKRLVLLSDADAEVLIHELQNLAIYHSFDKMFISSEMKAYKPSDKVVRYITKHLLFEKETTLLVGDSLVDKQTAEKLGIQFIPISSRNSDLKNIFLKKGEQAL